MTTKTVIFEDKYETDISQFSTTTEVDEFLEQKLGRTLNVVRQRNDYINP